MTKSFSVELRDMMRTEPFDCKKARKLSLKLHKTEAEGHPLTKLTERLWMDLTDVNDRRLKATACPDQMVGLRGWLTSAHCSEEQ